MRKTATLLISLMLFSSVSTEAAVPPKKGSKCPKAGLIKEYQGKQFTCQKSSGRLIWSSGKKLPIKSVPTPSPSASFTNSTLVYESPSIPSENLDNCRIVESSSMRVASQKFSGFPSQELVTKHKGTLNYLVVPVDWQDVPGQSNFRERVRDQIGLFEDWVTTVSESQLRINWKLHDSWIRLPGSSQDYAVPFSEASPQTSIFWQKVTKVVDPQVDFSNIDVIIFLLPLGQKVVPEGAQELYSFGSIKEFPLNEGKPIAFMAPGYRWDQDNVVIWSYLAHELGHLLGFAHFGSPRMGDPGDFRPYDLMGNQDQARTLTGWWRFLAGWLDESKVFCINLNRLQSAKLTLVPIDENGSGIKLIIVRLSSQEAILIESRRETKFYKGVGIRHDLNGIVAYKYDSRFGHLEDFFKPLASFKSLEEFNWDGKVRITSKTGDIIETDGLKIQFVSSGKYDRVQIDKLPTNYSPKLPSPAPAPSPTTTDFGVLPEMSGGALRTSESSGESTWYGRYFNSYRILVKSKTNPNLPPMFDTGIVNDYKSPIRVKLTNLTCNRDEVEVAYFYSGLNGQGKIVSIENPSSLAAVNTSPDGKCVGYWSNNSVKP